MRVRTGAVSAAMGAVALVVALTGCNDSGSGESDSSGSQAGDEKTTYRLGEASPPQESTMQKYQGSTFTVTPTMVETGTKADMDGSGLKQDKDDGPTVPVYVRATLALKSGQAMEAGDMDNDLAVKTNTGERKGALIVLMGQAKWPNCPAFDTSKMVGAGQSENICQVFLIPEGQKAAAVELSQGFNSEPLEWPVSG